MIEMLKKWHMPWRGQKCIKHWKISSTTIGAQRSIRNLLSQFFTDTFIKRILACSFILTIQKKVTIFSIMYGRYSNPIHNMILNFNFPFLYYQYIISLLWEAVYVVVSLIINIQSQTILIIGYHFLMLPDLIFPLGKLQTKCFST